MKIGLTYDLRSDYLAQGYSLEETAEFDAEVTVATLEESLRLCGHSTERIGSADALVRRLARGDRWDFVFNICEGLRGLGREALVPALLDHYGIPYSFSDPLVLALTLHKGWTKTFVRAAGLPTADFLVYEKRSDLERLTFGAPYFVKPVAEGTGKGCTAKSIVRERAALGDVCDELVARFRQDVLIESFLPGREFTVGIVGTGEAATVVGSMEIHLNAGADREIYSYDNKAEYQQRVTYQKCRPQDDPAAAAAEDLALRAWKILRCRDGGRIDIRCDASQNPMFLEVNPLAGLNPQDSDLPILARMQGISYHDLIRRIMDSATA